MRSRSSFKDRSIWSENEIHFWVTFASLLALGILLNSIESLILPRGWPIRIGLANLSLLCGLYLLKWRDVFWLGILRVVVSSMIFGYFFHLGMWMSLAGNLAAVCVMGIGFRIPSKVISTFGISLLGAAAHISAQIAVFAIIFAPSIRQLYPVFMAFSILSGSIIGGLMMQIERRLAFNR